MARRSGIWERKGRGWYTTIRGRQVPLGKDRKDAEYAFARLVMNGSDVIPNIGVAELTQLWLNDIKENRAAATWETSRQYARIWCKRFGRMRAAQLRPLHVTAWLTTETTWGKNTRSIAARSLRACFWWGVDQGFLDANPLARLRVPKPERRPPVGEAVLAKWMESIEAPALRLWVDVALATGCRPGEMASMKAEGLIGEAGCIPRGVRLVGKEGERVISLSEAVAKQLAVLAKQHPSGPILRSPTGQPWNRFSLAWHFRETSKRSGVSVVPYHLRGVFATRSLRVNGEIVTAKLLGHKSLAMIAAHYEGLDMDDLRAAAERVNTPRPQEAPGPPPSPVAPAIRPASRGHTGEKTRPRSRVGGRGRVS